MITEKQLSMGGVLLRQIELSDCTDEYVNWLNDPEVNQYLETRWEDQTLEKVMSFVQEQRKSENSILFAIILQDMGKHIGNIKIGPINKYHMHADMSCFIGAKECWHKGIATKAMNLICGFGINDLHLNRIECGVYSSAIGSWKALEKNGFKREGVFRKQVVSNGEYIDLYRYGLLASEYKAL